MASYKWPSVIPTSSLGITALTGDVTAAGPGPAVATISSGVVTNAKLATMAAMSIKGNATGGIAAPTDLTSAQATAILAAMIGDSGSGGVKGLVPAPAAGDSAAMKFLSAAGTWNIPAGTGGSGNVNGPSTSTANAISTYADATGTLLLDTDTSVISGGGFTSFGTVVNALNLQSATNTYFIGKELQITTVLGSSTTITNLSANQALEFDSVSDLNVLATNTLGLSGNATNIGANTSVVISAGNASVDIQAATSVNLSPTQTLNLQSGAGFDIALAPGAGGIADVTGNLRASNLVSNNIKGDSSPNFVKINNELAFTGDSGGSQISTSGSSLNIAPLGDLFLNTSSGANMALNSAGTMSLASTTTFDILASDAISITTAVATKAITIQSSGQLLLATLTSGAGNSIIIRPVSGQPIVLDSFSLFKEQSTPGTGPSITSGYGSFYAGNNGSPYYKNAAGTVTKLDSFQSPITIGALDAQAANASGLALVANVLSTQSADATHPGLMNITTQTIAGAKTFSGGVTATVTGTASGNTTYSANNHGVVISSATNAMTVIAPDASTSKLLKSGGSSADPSWLAYDNANTASTIVARDSSGNFSAGTITAALTGTASGNTAYAANNHGIVVSGTANTMTVIAPDASTTKVLTSGGSSADPTWQDVPAAATQSYELNNVGFATSVASNILTVALKQSDGSTNPSTGSAAAKAGFRNSTAGTGGYVERSVTAALSLTISQASSLGLPAAVASYLYFYLIDSNGSGTMKLGASQVKYDEGSLQTTVAESATVTISNASPGVITETGHTRNANDPIRFTTTGGLPTGLSTGTTYYVKSPITNAYNVSATPGGANINTSSAGSGTHTAHCFGYRLASDGNYSNVAVRFIGRGLFNEATAGTWASNSTENSLSLAIDQRQKIYAEYTGNAATAITSNVTNVDYATNVIDTHGAFNGTMFLAPLTGWYSVGTAILLGGAGSAFDIQWYVNGSAKLSQSNGGASSVGRGFSTGFLLNQGDLLSVRLTVGGTLSNSAVAHWISISSQG